MFITIQDVLFWSAIVWLLYEPCGSREFIMAYIQALDAQNPEQAIRVFPGSLAGLVRSVLSSGAVQRHVRMALGYKYPGAFLFIEGADRKSLFGYRALRVKKGAW